MDKRKYYVSVQARTVLANPGDAAYEYEIEATPEEVDRLRELFVELDKYDDASAFRQMFKPGIPYHQDWENDGYDDALYLIYRSIRELGTAETKAHLASLERQ